MKLVAFRVHEFRSVDDSGWIETDQVTALIGTNESGKTNVLMPLWKLKGGQIDPVADYPRKRYHEIRAMKDKPVFIEARFQVPSELSVQLAKFLRVPRDRVEQVIVHRDFAGQYRVEYPAAAGAGPTLHKHALLAEFDEASADIERANVADEAEEKVRKAITDAIQVARKVITDSPNDAVDQSTLVTANKGLAAVDTKTAPATSVVSARFAQVVKSMTDHASIESDAQAAKELVVNAIPSFVYYSNYGNLDSEIYLPHVIENLRRKDLGQREQAKARTLKVLFDFVKLQPQEILDMGAEANITTSAAELKPDQLRQIEATAKKKKERDILLQSASTELTRKFREWWKQGDYRFRFAADGNHFRIWVSDDKRPEDIELESRSTGLQWFFSFYLVFLVESADAHAGAILLLDEPGLSLHPLAQSDLSLFFDGLALTNQLLYTTHSPFMVDADHLDRARSVYTDKGGVTQVSPDLRAPLDESDQAKSVYAAYAALKMTVSDTVMLGCLPVIVEGPSDQHYLSTIKNYLIGRGVFKPTRDVVFIPSGGVRGVKPIAALVMGRDDALPCVLIDSDVQGAQFAASLRSSLYSGDKSRVHLAGDYVTIPHAEIEDLLPPDFMIRIIDRYLVKPADLERDFADVHVKDQPLIPQVEAYAQKNGIDLPEGWKVDVAKRVKAAVTRSQNDAFEGADNYVDAWGKLFAALEAPGTVMTV